MSPDLIEFIMRHPAQQRACAEIADLLTELRSCGEVLANADRYDHFQRRLYLEVITVQARRDVIRREIKRVERGAAVGSEALATLPDLDALGGPLPFSSQFTDELTSSRVAGDPTIYARLLVEEIVTDRIERQLRSVGDALAWRALQFDRRIVWALSRNERTGAMTVRFGARSPARFPFRLRSRRSRRALNLS